jgi:ubiquinone/menaquinone biosynthesis C-methylase UbiE
VTAVDFSRGMLDRARARAGDRAIRFAEHDITTRAPFDDASFDAVVCCLALEHVETLAPFFAEAARLLRAGGALVVSDMHSAMRLRGKQANFDDPNAGVEVRVEGYLHLVSEYVMGVLAAGLTLEVIEEHSPDAALAERFPRAQRYVGWPMLLALRARKS